MHQHSINEDISPVIMNPIKNETAVKSNSKKRDEVQFIQPEFMVESELHEQTFGVTNQSVVSEVKVPIV